MNHTEFQEDCELLSETHQDKYLLAHMNDEQKQFLARKSLTIQMVREGRFSQSVYSEVKEWCASINLMLGFRYFHLDAF